MKPEEMINLALQEEIEVEPQAYIPEIVLMDGVIAESRPLNVNTMPLYIALHLQKAGLCILKKPEYLAEEFVNNLIEKEKSQNTFLQLPEYFFEVARILMPEGVSKEVLELKRIRQTKLWEGLERLDGKVLYVTGLTSWEFNEMRDAVIRAMELGHKVEVSNE